MLLITIIYFFFSLRYREVHLQQLRKDLKIQESKDLKFVVYDKNRNRREIQLTSTKDSIYIVYPNLNHSYSKENRNFYDYLAIGDSILIEAYSDTINVFRGGERRFWIKSR